MKKLIPVFCKLTSICIVFALIIMLITPVFVPKFTDTFATTSVIDGFYAMPQDNIDVLFLGSSQIMTAISPMQIYEEYGITGYNLGTEQQNLIASYYLLKEALSYQKPQIVMLDVMFLFPYAQNTPLNSDEKFVRKSIDYMKWSSNKWEYIKTVCSLDSTHEIRNYLVPFLRYHSRWADLTLEDFTYLFQDKHNPLRGFCISKRVENDDQFTGFTLSDSTAHAELLPTMEEYLYKIIHLCQEQNISLVLIKTPKANGSFNEACHNTIQDLADSEEISFIDFNEQNAFQAMNFDVTTDYNDGTHINYYGACKISDYIGQYLSNNYFLTDHRNLPEYAYWNIDLETYHKKISE